MVKTNSKKSVIALVVMAILLVLSMAMTITGAWFTDKVTNGNAGELDFGKIELTGVDAVSVAKAQDDCSDLMPGCSLAVSGTVTNAGEKAYVAYELTITFEEDVATPGVAANDPVELPENFTLPTTIGNNAQESTVSASITVAAVQYEHMTTAPADYAELAEMASSRIVGA